MRFLWLQTERITSPAHLSCLEEIMDHPDQRDLKKYSGAHLPVQVIRTAPMESEKKKNFAELLPRPLLPQISIMWAFLESYLKKTADVFRIFPETRTILEQRVTDLKDSFKLQAEGKDVDAELMGAHHIVVNYLVRCSLVDNALRRERKEELLFILQKVRAQLADAYGTTPAVIAVDKIDRYVVDLMFMLAESVNKAISDMSGKSWMECNMTLVAVLNVYRNQLNKLLEDFHIFINSGELGGATTPSFHAHAMSKRRIEGVAFLPEETRDDDTVLTKEHFARLGSRPLNGIYIRGNLEEIAVENFLLIAEILAEKHFGVVIEDEEETDFKVAGNTFILNNPEEEDRFKHFLKRVKRIASHISGSQYYPFRDFLKEMGSGEGEEITALLDRYAICFDEKAPLRGISERERVKKYCSYMRNITAKRRYWEKYTDRVGVSPVSEIFASAFMMKLKDQGIEERIRSVIGDVVPDGLSIGFSLTDYFAMGYKTQVIPAFSFSAEPSVWALYGKPVMEITERAMNTHWEQVYYITEAFLRSRGDAKAEDDVMQKLDELLGISRVLNEMSRAEVFFESFPNSLSFSCGDRGDRDIITTTKNYLRYFAECFAFARKKKILHLPGLCPRTTIINVEKADGHLLQTIEVTPICVYTPVMTLREFEKRLGPIDLLRETNARFELVGVGDHSHVVQKTGGECRTRGRPVFHRDKREVLRSKPRIDEEPLVEAISEMIKKYVFTPENSGNMKPLYFHHYMRGFIIQEYREHPDVTWKKIAEILLHADNRLYAVDRGANIDEILQEAFARSPHKKTEMEKASRCMKIIKEARDDALKRMTLITQRRNKLMEQIEEGRFMATFEIVMKAIAECRSHESFLESLEALRLPKDEKIQEHILYIFGVRLIERQTNLRDVSGGRAQDSLTKDNLDTITFFRLAELIAHESFKKVKGARLHQYTQNPEVMEEHLRDIDNSEYLLIEFIARTVYKYVSESAKRREGFQEMIKQYHEDHPFFKKMLSRIAEELRHKSYQTEEIWRAQGANPAEGYVDLIETCNLPKDKVARCMVDVEIQSETMNTLLKILQSNLTTQGEEPQERP